jgi:hypothetical protein
MRSTLQVNESFATFVLRVDALSAPDYVPSVEEVLLCRIRTTGITSQVEAASQPKRGAPGKRARAFRHHAVSCPTPRVRGRQRLRFLVPF